MTAPLPCACGSTALQEHNGPTCGPPSCAWCTEPSTEQVPAGTRITGHGPVRLYAWMCEACAREAAREREVSISA